MHIIKTFVALPHLLTSQSLSIGLSHFEDQYLPGVFGSEQQREFSRLKLSLLFNHCEILKDQDAETIPPLCHHPQ